MTAAYSEWLAKADADLGAGVALARKRRQQFPDQVCFLCQQSAEKSLKAFLAANDIAFPRIHNLLQLNDLCIHLDGRINALSADLAVLDLYAAEIRYPGTEATARGCASCCRRG